MNPDRGLPKPDQVLYLRASEKLAQSRPDFGTERYEKREFQNQVAQMFDKIRAEDDSLTWTDYTVESGIDRVTDDLFGILKEVLNSDLDKELGRLWVN
jgi:dTMP kinase